MFNCKEVEYKKKESRVVNDNSQDRWNQDSNEEDSFHLLIDKSSEAAAHSQYDSQLLANTASSELAQYATSFYNH